MATYDFPTIVNNAGTTLDGAHTDSVTTITLSTGGVAALGLTGSTNMIVTIITTATYETDAEVLEIIHATGTSGDTLTGATRGFNGSSATAFSDLDKVEIRITQSHLQQVYDVVTDGTADIAVNAATFSGDITLNENLTVKRDNYIDFWPGTPDESFITVSGLYDYGEVTQFAMTFQMRNSSSYGWIWRDAGDGVSDAAASLSTLGELTIKHNFKTFGDINMSTGKEFRIGTAAITAFDALGNNITNQGAQPRIYIEGTTDAALVIADSGAAANDRVFAIRNLDTLVELQRVDDDGIGFTPFITFDLAANETLIEALPTSNPGAGILWNNAGVPAIGT